MIMPMVKVTSVIWIITFTCLGPGSPSGGETWKEAVVPSELFRRWHPGSLMLSCFNEDICTHGQHNFA